MNIPITTKRTAGAMDSSTGMSAVMPPPAFARMSDWDFQCTLPFLMSK